MQSNQLRYIRDLLFSELKLSEYEVMIFLALMKSEKTTSPEFKKYINFSPEIIIENARKLEQKGMIIEINKNEFQALHPRFAIVNRYRKLCQENNIQFKKNIKIDNLGILLEKYQNTIK